MVIKSYNYVILIIAFWNTNFNKRINKYSCKLDKKNF